MVAGSVTRWPARRSLWHNCLRIKLSDPSRASDLRAYFRRLDALAVDNGDGTLDLYLLRPASTRDEERDLIRTYLEIWAKTTTLPPSSLNRAIRRGAAPHAQPPGEAGAPRSNGPSRRWLSQMSRRATSKPRARRTRRGAATAPTPRGGRGGGSRRAARCSTARSRMSALPEESAHGLGSVHICRRSPPRPRSAHDDSRGISFANRSKPRPRRSPAAAGAD